MDRVKHIKSIKIQNFKCFESFQADNFGQYNIVLGDNNVGKTSFLESLLFDENINQSISNLKNILYYKNITKLRNKLHNNINPLEFFLNKRTLSDKLLVNINYSDGYNIENLYQTEKVENLNESERENLLKSLNYGYRDKEILKIITNNNIEFRSFDSNENLESYDLMVPMLFPSIFYDIDLVTFYSENFTGSRNSKIALIKQLSIIISDISDIELVYIDKILIIGIWLYDSDRLIPLPMFGDGTVRLFRMIMEITICKDKYLCIDEIDTGIHFSKYKDFSRIVLSTANDNNVQLFISTHNEEFLKSFKEVLEEEQFQSYQNDTKCFSLKKLPKGDIKAYRYNFEEFEFAIEQENELR